MEKTKDNKLCVLITGAASGIGYAVADQFIKNGHTVYALDVKKSEIGIPLTADITDQTALESVLANLQENGVKLDIILNFAGVHTMGSFIESDFEKIRRVMEINFLGTVLVNKTFHPLLKEKGKIVITSSEVAPLAALPFNGIYSVSKTALDSYAQSLRQELNLLGQKVITLRPGAVETPLSKSSAVSTQKLCEETKLYKAESKNFCKIVEKFTGTPMKAEKFAHFAYKVAMKKHPKYVYAKHRNVGLILLGVLPKRLQCAVVKWLVKR